MDSSSQILLIVGACGAVVAAGFGVLAGTDLRVPPQQESVDQRVVVGTQDVFLASAPAYPSVAPEPLYPQAERAAMDDFAAAWDRAMSGAARDPQPVVFRPPADLPPPYEVQIQGEGPPARPRPTQPRDNQSRSAADGRYSYRGQNPSPAPVQPAEDDRSRY